MAALPAPSWRGGRLSAPGATNDPSRLTPFIRIQYVTRCRDAREQANTQRREGRLAVRALGSSTWRGAKPLLQYRRGRMLEVAFLHIKLSSPVVCFGCSRLFWVFFECAGRAGREGERTHTDTHAGSGTRHAEEHSEVADGEIKGWRGHSGFKRDSKKGRVQVWRRRLPEALPGRAHGLRAQGGDGVEG